MEIVDYTEVLAQLLNESENISALLAEQLEYIQLCYGVLQLIAGTVVLYVLGRVVFGILNLFEF